MPAAEGDGRGNCPDPCHKGETCHPRNEDFFYDTYQNLAVIGTCGNSNPRGSFLSGFDPETVHLKKVRTAGVCGFSGVVNDAACLSCTQIERANFWVKRTKLRFKFRVVTSFCYFPQIPFFLNFGPKGRTLRLDIQAGKDATPFGKMVHSSPHGDDFF